MTQEKKNTKGINQTTLSSIHQKTNYQNEYYRKTENINKYKYYILESKVI